MKLSFLLRLQECCADAEPSEVLAGTKTSTAIKAEGPDSDAGDAAYCTLSSSVEPRFVSATITKTAVKKEQSDCENNFAMLRDRRALLPPTMGTQTLTFVKGEQADADPGNSVACAIPKCFSR